MRVDDRWRSGVSSINGDYSTKSARRKDKCSEKGAACESWRYSFIRWRTDRRLALALEASQALK